jgi:hypothetical protein
MIKLCDLNLHVNDSQVLVKVFNLNFISNHFSVSYTFLGAHTHTHTHTRIHYCYHQHHYQHREELIMDVEILHNYKLGFSHISSNISITIIVVPLHRIFYR